VNERSAGIALADPDLNPLRILLAQSLAMLGVVGHIGASFDRKVMSVDLRQAKALLASITMKALSCFATVAPAGWTAASPLQITTSPRYWSLG